MVVVAGSIGMAGAAALAAQGALRGGAGLVTWAGPEPLLPIVQGLVPEATAIPLPEQEGILDEGAAPLILEALRPGDALAIGPGLGATEATGRLVARLLAEAGAPAVVDADGLNALAALGSGTAARFVPGAARVFTPHPKEAARLVAWEVDAVLADPIGAAEAIAGEWSATALLKGSPTLVRERGGRLYINGSGDVALATGGSGDVLTGVLAAFLAQGYPAGEAAALAAYVHGRAGELVRETVGRHGSTAADVARAVGFALKELEG